MSSWRVPLTTSNGENCTAPGSRDSNLGIILAPRASLTPQVRVNVNCSATSTAFLSVFHQHLIRSDVSLFSAFDRGACACANSTVKNTTITAAHTFKLQSLLTMTTLLHRKAHAHRTHEKMSRRFGLAHSPPCITAAKRKRDSAQPQREAQAGQRAASTRSASATARSLKRRGGRAINRMSQRPPLTARPAWLSD